MMQKKKIKIRPHSNGHEFEAHSGWALVDDLKDDSKLSKLEKYSLIPVLSMNFIFLVQRRLLVFGQKIGSGGEPPSLRMACYPRALAPVNLKLVLNELRCI